MSGIPPKEDPEPLENPEEEEVFHCVTCDGEFAEDELDENGDCADCAAADEPDEDPEKTDEAD